MGRKLPRIFSFLLPVALTILFAFISSCTGDTGESITTGGAVPRWVWSLGDNGNSIVIDRETHQPIRDVNPEEAFGIIGTGERLNYPVIVDVRTPQEYAEGHIRDAINVDYESAAFTDEIDVFDKNTLYLLYCRSGRRSANARDTMEGLGFRYIINMTGGFSEWVSAGLPVAEESDE